LTQPSAGESPLNPFWGSHLLTEETIEDFRCGPSILRCRARPQELWTAHSYSELKEGDDLKSQAMHQTTTPSWSRWPLIDTPREVEFTPALPDRSVVVKPDFPLRLTPAQTARVFVRIPLWITLRVIAEAPTTLATLPTMLLSNTWFGSFTGGELCYWVSSSARRQFVSDPAKPHLVICPVRILNDSGEELRFEKLCLRVETLGLYRATDGQHWTDETEVRFKGELEGSEVLASGASKDMPANSLRLAEPRRPLRKGFATRAFSGLRNIAGLGV